MKALRLQPPQVARRERPPIRDHRRRGGLQVLANQSELLGHRRVPVLVAIHGVPEQRQRAVLVHVRAQARMHHQRAGRRIQAATALGDVRRLQVSVAANGLAIDHALPRLAPA